MIFKFSFSLFCFFWIRADSTVPRGLQEGVADGGKQYNPGFKIRVTQAALDYVETLANKAMQDQFPRIRINDVKGDIQGGDITLTNIRITKFKTPEKHTVNLEPSDSIQWSTADSDISLQGDFLTHQQVLLSKAAISGDFDAVASNVDFTISFSLSKSEDGGFSVKSRQCTANVKSLTANIHTRSGLASLFKNTLVNRMRPLIATEMCNEARRFIDVELNKQLGTMPTKLPLNETRYGLRNAKKDDRANRVIPDDNDDDGDDSRTTPRSNRYSGATEKPKNGNGGLRRLAKTVSKSLVLDYSSIKNPIVTQKYVETYNRGEISYEAQGGTPFYPTDLQEPIPFPTDRMIYLTASDYVVNSLFWHAYKHGLVTFRANKQTNPEYEFMLKTSCDDDAFGVCLGNVIPEVGKSFPNSEAELVFQGVKAPAVYFHKDGKVKFVAPAYVTAYAKQGGDLKEMITADLNVEGQMRVWIDDLFVKGNGTITKFNMTLRNNNLKDFTQAKLDEFANMARAMFQELGNNELEKGLPLPAIQGASLVRPILHIYERTVRIDTDMQIDENVLTLLAIEALRNGNSKVTIDES